jgi:hypothetical protein
LTERWGAVAFGGLAKLWDDDLEALITEDLYYSVGAGIRFMINTDQKINFRIDAAVGNGDNKGIYVGIPGSILMYQWERGAWEFRPYVRFRWKSADFNNRYYGLDREDPGSAVDTQIAADIRFHVWRNLYLLARGSILFLDSDTRDISFVDDSTQAEGFFGVGFFNDKKNPVDTLASKPIFVWHTDGDRIQFE